MDKLQINGENSDSPSFHIQSGNFLAVAEMSKINRSMLDIYLADVNPEIIKNLLLHIDDDSIFFFNRLKVPDQIAGKGFGKILLNAVTVYCKERGITLINPINAYGRLNTQEVIAFHEKFNFHLLHPAGLVIYNANIVSLTLNNKVKNKIK